MKTLVIVESPNKIKSIEKYLGDDYKVLASVGHIVRLPSSGTHRFGVDMETWEPQYKIDSRKQEVVDKLKKAVAKSKEVLIATDPDREGEAIAENLVHFLKIKNKYKRIRFNEITKDAVIESVNSPTIIDEALVTSQKTRRILDRIIGYKLSTLMRNKISNSPTVPSAGRVQSIALKKVIEREEEIDAFVPIKYATAEAVINEEVRASLVSGNFHDKKEWIDPLKVDEVKKDFKGALTVTDVQTSKRNDAKKSPFKQAVLYKRADSTYGLTAKAVQRAAQKLYEGFGDGGLISYPRTDSTRLSPVFVKAATTYITKKYGKEFLAEEIKGTAGAQDAHEAIRPTDPTLTPAKAKAKFNLDSAEEKVYTLIYNNTLQALMKPSVKEILRYSLKEGKNDFRMSSSKVIFEGYLKITGYSKSKELPKYSKGEVLPVKDYVVTDSETKPPARYNDGSLIELLDNIGVGRPSTFATTVNILKDRMYVDLLGRSFKPTEFGKLVWKKLHEAFPDIMTETYTADMEKQLDEIAIGKGNNKELLDKFWGSFEQELQTATHTLSLTKLSSIPAGKDCPRCSNPLIVRVNKMQGTKFFACSNFPECTHTEKDPSEKRRGFFFRKK